MVNRAARTMPLSSILTVTAADLSTSTLEETQAPSALELRLSANDLLKRWKLQKPSRRVKTVLAALERKWHSWPVDRQLKLLVAIRALANAERLKKLKAPKDSSDQLVEVAQLGTAAALIATKLESIGTHRPITRLLRSFAGKVFQATTDAQLGHALMFASMALKQFLAENPKNPTERISNRMIGELASFASGMKIGRLREDTIRRYASWKPRLTEPISKYWRKNIRLMIKDSIILERRVMPTGKSLKRL